MVGERDVIEIIVGVVGVEGGPAAVPALQALDPFARPLDRLRVLPVRCAEAVAV